MQLLRTVARLYVWDQDGLDDLSDLSNLSIFVNVSGLKSATPTYRSTTLWLGATLVDDLEDLDCDISFVRICLGSKVQPLRTVARLYGWEKDDLDYLSGLSFVGICLGSKMQPLRTVARLCG